MEYYFYKITNFFFIRITCTNELHNIEKTLPLNLVVSTQQTLYKQCTDLSEKTHSQIHYRRLTRAEISQCWFCRRVQRCQRIDSWQWNGVWTLSYCWRSGGHAWEHTAACGDKECISLWPPWQKDRCSAKPYCICFHTEHKRVQLLATDMSRAYAAIQSCQIRTFTNHWSNTV